MEIKMNKPLISIVVPVYNVESFLDKCIESLITQTYSNIEIILVDDGSTDHSGKICDRYSEENANIIAVHQKNQGLSGARNAGVKIAEGKYITFVDSDDYITIDFLDTLYASMVKYNADIAMCGPFKFYEDEQVRSESIEREYTYTSQEAIGAMLYRKKVNSYAWGKLYRAEIVKEISFPEGKLFEDLFTIYKMYDLASVVIYIEKQMYYYRQRRGSIVNSVFEPKKMQLLEANKEILKFVKEKYPMVHKAAISKYYTSAVDLLRKIPYGRKYALEKKNLILIIKKYRNVVWRDKNNKNLIRGMAFVSSLSINLLIMGCSMYSFITLKLKIKLRDAI